MRLADVLSSLRILAALLVFVLVLPGWWAAAFIVLAIGWVTDLLDGPAAKRYGSLRDSRPDLDMDGIADSLLAFGSTLALVLYAFFHGHFLLGILLGILWFVTVGVGTKMALIMNEPLTAGNRKLIAFNMVVFHGLLQIAVTIWVYAYMSGGLLLAGIAGAVVAFIAGVQVPKMKLWLAGKFA